MFRFETSSSLPLGVLSNVLEGGCGIWVVKGLHGTYILCMPHIQAHMRLVFLIFKIDKYYKIIVIAMFFLINNSIDGNNNM